jgi:hypothetical protein
MTHLRLLPALLIFALLIGAAPAAGAPAVGVTLDSGPGGEAKAFEEFFEAGATAIEAPQPWSTLEPAPGRFHLADVAAIVGGVRSTPAMRIMVIPAAVETTRRSVPRDLRTAPWDSRRMIDRYRALLRRLASHLSPQARYVSIANEADVYFGAHPGELPAFLRFARAEIAELHRLAPRVKVGVTVTYSGLSTPHPGIARKLARLGDATMLTYYPLVGNYRMRSPRAPLHDIPRMVRLAHGRPLVLQEMGYSSAHRLGSSPAAQASFVRNVFTAASRAPQALPFLSFYSLYDLPAPACRSRSPQVTFLCSLGLHYRNGHAKPAWRAFRAGVSGAEGTSAASLSQVRVGIPRPKWCPRP